MPLHFLAEHFLMLLLFLIQPASLFLVLSLESLLPFPKPELHLGTDDILAARTLQVKVMLGTAQPLRNTGELTAHIGESLLQADALAVGLRCCSHAFYLFYASESHSSPRISRMKPL